jgi:translation elongation factor EF-Ts
VTQWLEENQLAVDTGIKNEITEDFIAGLKNLFEEHYISIPDDKVDTVESMAASIHEMEERLDEQVKANVKLQNRLNESARKEILSTVSEGLVDTQKDKLSKLAEAVEFVSEEDFTKKVTTFKEAYFSEKKAATATSEVADETPVEGVEAPATNPAMDAYTAALARWK